MSEPSSLSVLPRPAESAYATVGIVGLGLLGGSIALAVREVWPATKIVAVDNSHVLDLATQARTIDAGSVELSVLADADLVILAAPIQQNLDIIGRLAGYLKPSALVTDVGSTKRDIVQAAAGVPSGSFTFVAGHPIAGAAVGGLQNARADLFRNRPWLVTPTSSVPETAVARVLAFAAGLGATPSVMTLADHDRVFAFVSHLPQQREVLHVAGTDLEDVAVALDQVDLADVHHLGHQRHVLGFRRVAKQVQPLFAKPLEGVRRTARLEGAAAENLRASPSHRRRRRAHLLLALS